MRLYNTVWILGDTIAVFAYVNLQTAAVSIYKQTFHKLCLWISPIRLVGHLVCWSYKYHLASVVIISWFTRGYNA